MANVNVTLAKVVKAPNLVRGEMAELPFVTATSDTAGGDTETCTFDCPNGAVLFVVESALTGITFEFDKGDAWAGEAVSFTTAGTSPAGLNVCYAVDSAKIAKWDATNKKYTAKVKITPASGKKLVTDHELKYAVIGL